MRSVAEITRLHIEVPGSWGFEYSRSDFYYRSHTDERFDDTGFGDLADAGTDPNQLPHFIGEAYIAAYQRQVGSVIPTDWLVWGNDRGQTEAAQIDRDLGYLAVDLGEALVDNHFVTQHMTLSGRWGIWSRIFNTAISAIESYGYLGTHPQ